MWLLEATAQDIKTDIKTVSDKVDKTLDDLLNKIETVYKQPSDPNFRIKFETAIKRVETSKEQDRPEQLKNNIQQFLDLIKNEYPGGAAKFNTWVKSKEALAQNYNTLDMYVSSPTTAEPEKEISRRNTILKLWPKFVDFMKEFFIISDFGMHKADVTRAENAIKKLKENLAAINSAIENYTAVYKGDNSAQNDSDVQIPDEEAVVFEDFKVALTNINVALIGALKSQLPTVTKEIVKANELVENSLKEIEQLTKNKELSLATSNFDRTLKYGSKPTKKDWDTILKNDSSEKTWEAYYNEVWGDNADEVKDLGRAFLNETSVLGFSNRKNFFIDFIINWITSGKLHISSQDYTAIHNAVARGYLTADMLRQTVNDGTTFTNIVFSNDLYRITSVIDLMEYFRLQSEAIKACSKDEFSQPLLKDKYDSTKLPLYLRDLFFAPGNSIAAVQDYIEGNVEIDRIKPLDRVIREMTVAGIKTDLNQNDNKNKTAFNIDTFINQMADSLKENATTISKSGAAKLIYYIITRQADPAVKTGLINAFNKSYSVYGSTGKSGLTASDEIDCRHACEQFDLDGTNKATGAINAILSRTSTK